MYLHCNSLPFYFLPSGGVLSDRYNRYNVLLATQIASLIQATLLVALVLFTQYSIWEIFALSVVLGMINAFDVPARQSLVYQMVDTIENLPNAIALNSSMVNVARLIGPAISGIVLEHFGAGICFLMNALSFLAVIVSLVLYEIPEIYSTTACSKRYWSISKKDGTIYRRNPSMGSVILLLACVSFFVLPFMTLLPIYAKDIFHGNASTYGYLNSFIGIGAIGRSIFLSLVTYDDQL